MLRARLIVTCLASSLLLSGLSNEFPTYSSGLAANAIPIAVNSELTISTTIHNSYQYPMNYFAIYLILNSTGYTAAVEQTQGQLPNQGNDTATVSWTPEQAGTFRINTFIVSALDVPELLMPRSTTMVEAIENQSNVNLANTISNYESIGAQSSENSSLLGKAEPIPTLAQLKQYALTKINEDRGNFTAPPVKLSANPAAQAQADEMLNTKFLSHWSLSGMKPYMRYTVMGGEGYVAQNVAGGPLNTKVCNATIASCSLTASDLYRLIDTNEYNLVNNDGDCCGNLHKDNLLDPFHTDVSIGIAYNNYSFYIVQNFENNYVVFDKPITTDNKTITMSGKVLSGTLSQVLIYYDDPPTHQIYLQNRDQTTYDPGVFVGGVVADSSGYSAGITLNATQWISASTLSLTFDMSPIMTKPGVYTIYAFFDDNNNHHFVVTSYSVFHS